MEPALAFAINCAVAAALASTAVKIAQCSKKRGWGAERDAWMLLTCALTKVIEEIPGLGVMWVAASEKAHAGGRADCNIAICAGK